MSTHAAPNPSPLLPAPYRVRRVRRDTEDTFSLELAPADGGERMVHAPGQFNMLYVLGVGEVPISIASDPKALHLEHTTRAVGNVTNAMARLRKGDTLGLRGPYGTGWPMEAAEGRDVVLVAGGIGLAPLRPALTRLIAERERYGRIVLLYGARTPLDILYRPDFERWRRHHQVQILVTVDRAVGAWSGLVGVVTNLIRRAPFDAENSVAMVCGPEIMMRYAAEALIRRGVGAERIHVSMERNMKCAVGFCGHCQFGPTFVCRDGPVFPYARIEGLLRAAEI
ncbi:MAG: FAD/NAD(P)-binding protein [Myxococcales bacterium]|nr:FAD/NAD(P)-binding protein [Myxococcales bacterium]